MKACPIKFNHPSEAQQLMGVGPKLCDRLTEKMKDYCKSNGLPMPKLNRKGVYPFLNECLRPINPKINPCFLSCSPAKVCSRADRKRSTADDLAAINPAPPAKRSRKQGVAKPYIPALRSGAYAILLALSARPEDSSTGLTKAQIIEQGQQFCNTSFTAPQDTTKYHTAWSGMKTLEGKDLAYEKGRPLRRWYLTEEGWEVAKKIRAVKERGLVEAAGTEQCGGAVVCGGNAAARLSEGSRQEPSAFLSELDDSDEADEPLEPPLRAAQPSKRKIDADSMLQPTRSAMHKSSTCVKRGFGGNLTAGLGAIEDIAIPASRVARFQRLDDLVGLQTLAQEAARSGGIDRLDGHSALPRGGSSFQPGGFDRLSPLQGLSNILQETNKTNSLERGQRLGGAVQDKFGTFSGSKVRTTPSKTEALRNSSPVNTFPRKEVIEIGSSPEKPRRQADDDRLRSSPAPPKWGEDRSSPVPPNWGQGGNQPIPDLPQWGQRNAIQIQSSPELPRWTQEDSRITPWTQSRPEWSQDEISRSRLNSEPRVHQKDSEPRDNVRPKARDEPKVAIPPPKAAPSFPTFQPIQLQPGSFTVQLVLDNREMRAKNDRDYIQDELVKKGINPIVRPLEIGDFLWVAKCNDPALLARHDEEGDEVMLDYVVERKRLDDLCGSIKDGRFHEQKFRLRKSGVQHVVYIIEEFTVSTERMTNWNEAIETAIASTQVVDGYFIKKTQKLDDTIRYIARMTVILQKMYEVT